MKISIITAAFNASSTIAGTLDSVARQSYSDVEHIVVDGASTDDTLEIVKRHGKHVARIVSEPDRGPYDAMNKGISIATGDLVAILNADDVYPRSNVLHSVEEVMRRENLDALIGDVAFFRPGAPTHVIRRYRSNRFSPARIARGWMPAHPAMFLHRRVYDRFGLYRTNYRIAADFEYVARIFYGHGLRLRCVPEVLVHMRTGGISTAGYRSTILLNQEVLRACRENGIRTNLLLILSKYPAKLLEFIRR